MAKKRKHQSAPGDQQANKKPNYQNPLLEQQTAFLASLSDKDRFEFFAPSYDTARRAELWTQQADLGEELVNDYSWATPDERALRVLKHFAPIVEMASGQGYWLRMMQDHGIDAVGYDIDPDKGGTISKNTATKSQNLVKRGGPKVLEKPENRRRTLFLCYPDENTTTPNDVDEQDAKDDQPRSLASTCLQHYAGDYVIHVGELFMDSTLSMDQAPWGRSSSPEFQEQLAAQFHCILKVGLPSWLHVRDTLTVWKRSQVCSIVFQAEDGDDEGDEEYEYRHIPAEERLPVDVAAPCLQHLLDETLKPVDVGSTPSVPEKLPPKNKKKKQMQRQDSNEYIAPW